MNEDKRIIRSLMNTIEAKNNRIAAMEMFMANSPCPDSSEPDCYCSCTKHGVCQTCGGDGTFLGAFLKQRG